jgi:hypothetical protein
MFGDKFGSLSGAPQIAGIDSADRMHRKRIHHPGELTSTPLVEFWIGMTAEPAGHVGFCVTN